GPARRPWSAARGEARPPPRDRRRGPPGRRGRRPRACRCARCLRRRTGPGAWLHHSRTAVPGGGFERRPYNTAPGRLCEDLGGVVITQAALARRLTTIALAAALAAGLAASGRPALGQGGAIRIGAVFAVTGPASSLGKPEKDTSAMLAAQLAA